MQWSSSYSASYYPSHKPSKQDLLGTAGEVRTTSKVMFSYGLLHMDTPVMVDQQKLAEPKEYLIKLEIKTKD